MSLNYLEKPKIETAVQEGLAPLTQSMEKVRNHLNKLLPKYKKQFLEKCGYLQIGKAFSKRLPHSKVR